VEQNKEKPTISLLPPAWSQWLYSSVTLPLVKR
jgi:hypothetical protein